MIFVYFFSSLVNLQTYCSYEEVKLVIFEFIESWYNNIRIHGTLGYITPNQKYNNYLSALTIV
ncbi:MAG: IS3 family transposase [Bacilli bacterium]